MFLLAVLEYIDSLGDDKFDQEHPLEAGMLDARCGFGCVPFMEGVNDITKHPDVHAVIEGERPKQFFEKLLDGEVLTFGYKWLRGVYRVITTFNKNLVIL